MFPIERTPLQPTGPAPGASPSQAPKISIEPERMQVIKEAFATYKNDANENTKLSWAHYKLAVSNQLNDTDAKTLSGRIGAFATATGLDFIKNGLDSIKTGLEFVNWLDEHRMIHPKTDELDTFIEKNFREKEPDEAVKPSASDVKTRAQRRETITAAYQEYMDVDPANPENKIAAYNTFIDKANVQMTTQEVKDIAHAYEARADISDFKGFARWLEGQPDLSRDPITPILDGKDPITVKKMMDTIFPTKKM